MTDIKKSMKIKAIITGVTGMVGEGVLQEVAITMIKVVLSGYDKPVLEVSDIVELSKR